MLPEQPAFLLLGPSIFKPYDAKVTDSIALTSDATCQCELPHCESFKISWLRFNRTIK
jgi:hypothetical protein